MRQATPAPARGRGPCRAGTAPQATTIGSFQNPRTAPTPTAAPRVHRRSSRLEPSVGHAHGRHRRLHHWRSEEHTSELQSLMRISYAVFCLKTKKNTTHDRNKHTNRQAYHVQTLQQSILATIQRNT